VSLLYPEEALILDTPWRPKFTQREWLSPRLQGVLALLGTPVLVHLAL